MMQDNGRNENKTHSSIISSDWQETASYENDSQARVL